MKQQKLDPNSKVCAYCGLEVSYSEKQQRWHHVEWNNWRRGQPKESREHAFFSEAKKYPRIVVITEQQWKIKQVGDKLDGKIPLSWSKEASKYE